MSRPYYETSKDLDREKQIAQVLNDAWNCTLVKMSVKYHLDYAITRNEEVVGYCELKSPNYALADFKRFGGFFISLDKFMAARRLYEATKSPCMIVINATDGVWYATFHDAILTSIKIKGRKDRNDWQDMEPCVVLNTDQFKLLKIVTKDS